MSIFRVFIYRMYKICMKCFVTLVSPSSFVEILRKVNKWYQTKHYCSLQKINDEVSQIDTCKSLK